MSKRVCIDAGHYGKYNQSPVVPSYYESDFTFKLQGYLVSELSKLGVESVITRKTQDEDLSLAKRGSASKGCDLFVSLHTNACATESVDSISVYHLTNDTDITIDDKSKQVAELMGIALHEVMSFTSGYRVLTKASDRDKDGDGKADDEYYGVLSAAKIAGTPAILVEHSFHTNTEATLWLLEDANVRSIAVAEAKTIAGYLGVSIAQNVIVVDNTSAITDNTEVTTASPTQDSYKAEEVDGVNLTAGLPENATTARYKVVEIPSGKQVGAYKKLSNAIKSVKEGNKTTGVYDALQSNKLIYYISATVNTQSTTPVKSTQKVVVITASALRIRSEASATSTCIGSIKKGINVTILSEVGTGSNAWGNVNYSGKTGWISMQYTSEV